MRGMRAAASRFVYFDPRLRPPVFQAPKHLVRGQSNIPHQLHEKKWQGKMAMPLRFSEVFCTRYNRHPSLSRMNSPSNRAIRIYISPLNHPELKLTTMDIRRAIAAFELNYPTLTLLSPEYLFTEYLLQHLTPYL